MLATKDTKKHEDKKRLATEDTEDTESTESW
jgi:hypothetical protein